MVRAIAIAREPIATPRAQPDARRPSPARDRRRKVFLDGRRLLGSELAGSCGRTVTDAGYGVGRRAISSALWGKVTTSASPMGTGARIGDMVEPSIDALRRTPGDVDTPSFRAAGVVVWGELVLATSPPVA